MRSQLYSLATVALFTALSFASNKTSFCMTRADAQQVADNYQNLQTQFSDALATASLSNNFTSYSDSIAVLINGGCNGPAILGDAIFGSRDEFLAGQGSQPSLPFYQIGLWHTCNQVVVRWRFVSLQMITGIMALETVPAPFNATFPWLIETAHSEFNSMPWLISLGVFTPDCNETAASSRKRRDLPMIGHIMGAGEPSEAVDFQKSAGRSLND
ncbi:hypothetical protein LTR56_006834 [Elasticomyces elasticus]|uniref:NTF2-like domain-containing protein n=1 Tax=Elasticomyces elasticus TaxID=574655 RepID=A0AAN7VXF0_9PEZI|nr:hypothetical protein LTR56_006834 [Elasticomyces elasticus]KAK3659520.1 hypothetical protein LTR22_008437 [Elasticomyces elasticus]KAK4923248.1 hypothetical protein LTR49_009511 [Elasticomyces elasticus]KAK5707917.1 hypothetical protein LTR97_000456 [Elasticomyces elasticus]KAK5727109.1 hypothetical protein LTR15_003001 [Elasticomyces elasticus]